MSKGRSLERFAPLAGVVFFILVVIIFILGSDEPEADEGTAKVVAYWAKHDDRAITEAILVLFASLFLFWFAGAVYSALKRDDDSGSRLPAVALGGAAIGSVGLLVFSAVYFALGDTTGDVPPAVTQTFSVMNTEFFAPTAGGLVLFLTATGLAALRTRALPAWLGWVSFVIALAMLTPAGFIGLLAALVWVPVVSIMLFVRGNQGAGVATTT